MPNISELGRRFSMCRNPAALGGEPGSVIKDKDKVDVRFAFCFPDTYEVGMSFLGEKILYELLNRHENWWCERAFMPWVDMKEQMEQLQIPLYCLESWRTRCGTSTLWGSRWNMNFATPTFWPCWIWPASRCGRPTGTKAGR